MQTQSSGRLIVDLDAIQANYRLIASRTAPSACGAVIKANAYGLGARRVAEALRQAGCRDFFVAHLEEARQIQPVVAGAAISILNGLQPGSEPDCAEAGFVPVLNTLGAVARWRSEARRRGTRLPAALQCDTGMTRLGLDPADAERLSARREFSADLDLRLIMAHLACADAEDHPANAAQLCVFGKVRALFPDVPASLANSGGAFLDPRFHFDLVRPGVALFGIAPLPAAAGLRPVARLSAAILQIRDVPEGTRVGYGLDYAAPGPRRLATLGVGYGDGWPRSLGGVGAAWLSGIRLPIVGRVSMDSMVADISDVAEGALTEGDRVELIGPSQSVEDVARAAGTIPYEILTRLGARCDRIYSPDETSAFAMAGNDA